MQLGIYFSIQSQAFLDHILHLNFTDCFGGEGLALDPNTSLQKLSKPLLSLSHWVPYTRMCIVPANAVYHQCLQGGSSTLVHYSDYLL